MTTPEDRTTTGAGPDRRRMLQATAVVAGAPALALGSRPARAADAKPATLSTVRRYRPKDTFFGRPLITKDELRDGPIPHRLVLGGFEGTDTRFAFYFPDKAGYQGRFIHFLQGGLGGTEPGGLVNTGPGNAYSALGDYLGLAVSLGGYLVESNQGHIGSTMCRKGGTDASIYGHRASAESARFARHLAVEIYGQAPHHGYVYGGSGGARRSVNCIENVDDVWDGAMPFMGGGAVAPAGQYDPKLPAALGAQGFSAMFNVQRLLGLEKLLAVVDAVDPGGSGDPYAGLNVEQRQALADLYRIGYPRGDELIIGYPMGQIGLWGWTAESMKAQNPAYWTDFWTKVGYEGHDAPYLFDRDLIDKEVVVSKVVTAGEMAQRVAAGGPEAGSPMTARARSLPADTPMAIEIGDQKGYLLGSSLKILSGKAAGRQLWCTGTPGKTLMSDGIGAAGNLKFSGVVAGDRIKIDNRDFLAFCYYYRHHVDDETRPGLLNWTLDDKPIYPQGVKLMTSNLMGPNFTAVPKKKMLFVQHDKDASLWPIAVIAYARAIEKAGGSANFRLRWVENCEHGGPPAIPITPAMNTRLVSVVGHVEQNLHDLVAWVERGVEPAQDRWTFRDSDQWFQLPATASERGGVQPVVRASTNGKARADAKAGQPVTLAVDAEAPAGSGYITKVEWDFDGQGRFPYVEAGVDGKSARVQASTQHAFDKPGVYFPSVRVTGHREGDVNARLRRVTNLARVRVVVS